MKKQVFEKQRFHFLKRHFYQNEKAENMLVVASRFVSTFKLIVAQLSHANKLNAPL